MFKAVKTALLDPLTKYGWVLAAADLADVALVA